MIRSFLHFGKKIATFLWIKSCSFFYRIFHKRSKYIKQLKNKHKGQTVFVVATGPSLTISDLDLIKDHFSISMNSIISSFDKTSFRPTYYLIQDGNVVDRLAEDINKSDLDMIFAGAGNSHLMKVNAGKRRYKNIKKKKIWYNLNSNYHYYEMCYKPNKAKMKFSNDFSKQAYDGYTVAYSAIQLAYFLGFSKVYLLGCDCTYGGHFDEKASDGNKDVAKPVYFEAYECAKTMIKLGSFEIYNCTRGGMLEVFERVSLEEAIGLNK